MIRIRSSADLPSEFALQKYDFVKEMDAGEWAAVLSARLEVYEIFKALSNSQALPDDDEILDVDRAARETDLAEGFAECKAAMDSIIQYPYSGSFWMPKRHLESNPTNVSQLRFGPVTSISVGDADDLSWRLRKLTSEATEPSTNFPKEFVK